MAAWVCTGPGCGAVYAVDAPCCPQCRATEHRSDWEEAADAVPASARAVLPMPVVPAAPASQSGTE